MPKDSSSQSASSKKKPYPVGPKDGSVHSSIQDLKASNKGLKRTIQELDYEVEEQKNAIVQLEGSLVEAEEKSENRKERLVHYKAKVLGLEKVNRDLREKALRLEQEILEARQQLSVANQAITAAQRALGTAHAGPQASAGTNSASGSSPSLNNPASSDKVKTGPNGTPLFNINMRTLTGDSWTLEMHKYETIDMLKSKIFMTRGIPPDEQRIIYAGTQLEDGRTLGDYDVHHEVVFHLTGRLRGC